MKYFMTVGSSNNCIYGVGITKAQSRKNAYDFLQKNNMSYVYFEKNAIECSERLFNYIKKRSGQGRINENNTWQMVDDKAELDIYIVNDICKKSKSKNKKMTEKEFKNISNIPDMLTVIFNMLNK